MTDPKPTPQDIVFAQSALTYLRTKLRDLGELDKPERQALDALEVVVGAQARALADEPVPPIDPEDERIVDELMHKRAQGLTERPMHAMQDPYKPKVGERVRLLSSPDPRDSAAVGLTFTIRSACATHDPCAYWVTEERFPWIHRDAVWEPVAAQEPTAEPPRCSFRAWTDADEGDEPHGSGEQCPRLATHRSCVPFATSLHCDAHKCRCAKPIKAEPTAEPAQAEAHPLGSALYAVCAAEPAQPEAEHHMRLELAEANAAIERLEAERDGWREKLNAEMRLHAKTRDDWEETANEIQAELTKAKAEVERLRGELAEKRALVADYERASKALRHELEARAERPEPSEALAALDQLFKYTMGSEFSQRERDIVRSALLPKGQQDSGSSGSVGDATREDALGAASASPVWTPTQPGDSSSDERPWNYEAPDDSEIGHLHELLPCDGYPAEPRIMTYSPDDGMRTKLWTGKHLENGSVVPWFRAFGVTVKAWRRAEPKGQPEPTTATLRDPPINDHKPTLSQPADPLAGMPTPWRERIESLERAVEGLKGGK